MIRVVVRGADKQCYCFRCYHDITRSDCVNLLRGQRRDTEIVIADETFQSALEKPLV